LRLTGKNARAMAADDASVSGADGGNRTRMTEVEGF